MSDLIVIGYPDEETAEKAWGELVKLQQDFLVDLEDAAIVRRDRKGKLYVTTPAHHAVAWGSLSGLFWGVLIGLIFLWPLAPLAGVAGGIMGAALGAAGNLGVKDDFRQRVQDLVQPGTSAILVIVRKVTPDKFIEAMRPYGGTVLQTSLPHDAEQQLMQALHGDDPAAPTWQQPAEPGRRPERADRGAGPGRRPARRRDRLLALRSRPARPVAPGRPRFAVDGAGRRAVGHRHQAGPAGRLARPGQHGGGQHGGQRHRQGPDGPALPLRRGSRPPPAAASSPELVLPVRARRERGGLRHRGGDRDAVAGRARDRAGLGGRRLTGGHRDALPVGCPGRNGHRRRGGAGDLALVAAAACLAAAIRPPRQAPASVAGEGLALIVNTSAGTAPARLARRLAADLPEATIIETSACEDLAGTLRLAAASARILGAAGGDGTVSAAAAVAVETGLPLLVIPAGPSTTSRPTSASRERATPWPRCATAKPSRRTSPWRAACCSSTPRAPGSTWTW